MRVKIDGDGINYMDIKKEKYQYEGGWLVKFF